MSEHRTDYERLLAGELVMSGGKIFGLCRTCGKIVRVNKPIVGSMHLCAEAGEA